MLAYLRFGSDPYDVTSFLHIINVPERNIRKITINRILATTESFGVDLFDAIGILVHEEKRIAMGDKKELSSLLELCHNVHKKIIAEVLLVPIKMLLWYSIFTCYVGAYS